MPRTVKLTPYAFSNDLDLRPSDPYDPTQEELDLGFLMRPGEHEDEVLNLDLRNSDAPWRQLRVRLDASLAQSELQRILPSSSNVADDTLMVVSLRCSATKLRRAVVLEPVGDGRWRGDAMFRKDDVRNVVQFQPRLVRKTRIPSAGAEIQEGLAGDAGSIIAEGRNVMVSVDASPQPIQGGTRVTWEDFGQSSNPWRREHASDLFHLELDDSQPVLWLNRRYDSLHAALHGHASFGVDAVIRHMANLAIAQSVWFQLFIAAAHAIDADEESGSVEPPESHWKRGVLSNYLTELFPNLSEEDRLRRLVDMRTADQISTLVSLAGTVTQRLVSASRLLGLAVRAGERGPEVGENR